MTTDTNPHAGLTGQFLGVPHVFPCTARAAELAAELADWHSTAHKIAVSWELAEELGRSTRLGIVEGLELADTYAFGEC